MTVAITRQREAYARMNGICVICGKRISEDETQWSVDHFIPRAIYKWVPNDATKKALESDDNLFVVHRRCNYKKCADLPSTDKIKNMHADEKTKDSMQNLYKNVESSVKAYRGIKQSTFDSQDRKCAACGKRIKLEDATLRRIDNHSGRVRDNAMCLCAECNLQACVSKKKKEIAKKVRQRQNKKKKDE